jgi:hypothetical protein
MKAIPLSIPLASMIPLAHAVQERLHSILTAHDEAKKAGRVDEVNSTAVEFKRLQDAQNVIDRAGKAHVFGW